MVIAPQSGQPLHHRSLLAYRVMAFVTGVVLLTGTLGLGVQWAGARSIKHSVGLLWLFHGYLYLLYVIAAFNLGLKSRWSFLRIAVIALAGTIPTASFFAEHYVTRRARADLSKGTASV